MAKKRKRGQNFTADDKEKLVKLLMAHKDTILNKKTNGATNQAKQKAWIDVTDLFNSSGTNYRAKESLMKMWEKLKTESITYYQQKIRNSTGTGGGPADIKVDPVLEQVCAILGRACTGILGVYDCDSEIIEIPPNNFLFPEDHNVLIEYGDIQPSPSSQEEKHIEPNISQDTSPTISAPLENCKTPKIPLWSRRRPRVPQINERSEAVGSLCSSFRNINSKKEDIEDLKKVLLQDEIEFKRNLYKLQLEAAQKEVEIKTEVLNQIKGGSLNIVQNLFGVTEKNNFMLYK